MRSWFTSGSAAWLLVFVVLGAASAAAHEARPQMLRSVAFEQRLGERIPLALEFRDESGRPVKIGDYFGPRPVVLVLAYYDCPMLCSLVLDGLVRSLRPLSFEAGKEFSVLAVSFDPREGPELAAAKREEALRRYGRPGGREGWHFLTGEREAIEKLTQAVGFHYVYDAEKDQFAHAAGIVILTPEGRIARYFYGVEHASRDLRLGLVEASAGRIGSAVDRMLLFCYSYDPSAGKYGIAIMNVLRLASAGTVLALGSFLVLMFRREKRARRPST